VEKDKTKSKSAPPAYGVGSGLTYNSYLKVPELTSLQLPLSEPAAHDEMLFIIIHQVYELWFKLINFELGAVIQKLNDNEIVFALKSLGRVDEILRVLVQQIDILETMTPVEFNKFRSNLMPASGFQSLQFREFELLAGTDRAEYEKFSAFDPEWKSTLEARANRPTLRDAFFGVLKSRKLTTDASPEGVQKAIVEIYGNDIYGTLQALCEGLIRFDELVSLWRYRHVQMVERMIGMKPGTGGSLGVNYLATTLRKRFFPELWQARTALG
jgi:tryptophan 2,3-dioxygenase